MFIEFTCPITKHKNYIRADDVVCIHTEQYENCIHTMIELRHGGCLLASETPQDLMGAINKHNI